MDISLDLIRKIASPDGIRRGRRVFESGAVHLTNVTESRVTARVRDTGYYEVNLSLTDNGDVDTSCTCPFSWSGKCKHIVATMFAAAEQSSRSSAGGGPGGMRIFSEGQAGMRRRGGRLPAWARNVDRLVPHRHSSREEPEEQSWRLAYTIIIRGRRRKIVPLRLRFKKDGTRGQTSILQRFNLYDGLHFDLTDRLLIPLLLQQGDYDLPAGKPGEELPAPESESMTVLWGDVVQALKGKELYLAGEKGLAEQRLEIHEEPACIRFSLSEAGRELMLNPEFEWKANSAPVSSDIVPLTDDPLWVLYGSDIMHLENMTARELVALQHMHTPMSVPPRDRETFLTDALPVLLARYPVRSDIVDLRTVDGPPAGTLYLREMDGELAVELRYRYEDVEIPGLPPLRQEPEIRSNSGSIISIRRKMEEESSLRSMLAEQSLVSKEYGVHGAYYTPTVHPLAWLTDMLPRLREAGFEIFGQDRLRRHRLHTAPPVLALRISSGIDWFDLKANISFEGTPTSLEAFMTAVRENDRFVKLADGTYGVIPEEWITRFKHTLMLGHEEEERLRFSRSHFALLDEIGRHVQEFETDAAFTATRERFHAFTSIRQMPLPRGFRGELRPYQKGGYDWLYFLQEFGFGGLLADDMGLGKTVQTLAILQYLYEQGEQLPTLIVVPTSLLFNWQNEAGTFTPGLRVLLYRGLHRKELRPLFGEHHLVITSYGILRRDSEFLREIQFAYVVLDESQNIKNYVSVNARAARRLRARHRLALTGTPVENNLTELWSQFQFLNPALLGGYASFSGNFARPIERLGDDDAITALRKLIHPFMLRRTKELVAAELPPKIENTVLCAMEPHQRTAYQHWREHFRRTILSSLDTVGLQRTRMKVLEGLMKLRLICCHPSLIDDQYKASSGKMDAFVDMLDDILAGGHKVLVFSQFVRMLTILRRHLDERRITYEYLDGKTVHRQERVERFQNDETVRVFLISLKAGGTGLNLTAADYVIHYDPWWNPAVEVQATDRTHRIGQTKQVFSYKLITRESVEEKILSLQTRKQELVHSVITAEADFVKALTREDIEELFA